MMYYAIYKCGKLENVYNNKEEFLSEWEDKTNSKFNKNLVSKFSRNKLYTINGYKYLTSRYNNFSNEIDYQNIFRNKKTDLSYYEYIYAFDIETSTFKINNRLLSIMYLGGLKGILVDTNITTENYTEYTTEYITIRDWKDFDNLMFELDNKMKELNLILIIYIHNLAYEFSFFQNSEFILTYFNNENLLSVQSRQPFRLKCSNIEFRCSYKLTGLSLNVLGQQLNLPKLTSVKEGYDTAYTPLSKLPESEFIYNERDLDVTLLAVIYELKKSNAYKSINDIRTLLTLTGLTRAENKLLSQKEVEQNYASFCKGESKLYNQRLTNGKLLYEFLEDAFIGGYVRANRNFQFIPCKNVASVDIASSYPTQMLNHKFPYNWIIEEDNLKEKLFEIINSNNNYIDYFKTSKSNKVFSECSIENWYFKAKSCLFPTYFIADITIKNVKLKEFKNNNEVPLISISKLFKEIKLSTKDYYEDNGRLIHCNNCRLTLTNVDLLLYQLFYSFEIVAVHALIHTNKKQKLNKYVINSVNFFAEQKRMFKALLKDNLNNINYDSFYSNTLNKYILSETEINAFLSLNDIDKKDFLERQLRLSKGRLNAQYGINVQKVNPDKIEYDIINNTWSHKKIEFKNDTKLLRNYSDGIYITAYARLHLLMQSYVLIKYTESTILYWDTDSIKFMNDIDNAINACNKFNNCLEIAWKVSKQFNFGIYDFEGKYDYFITGGAKSYLTVKDDKLECTISGVSKKETSKYYQELYNKNGFDNMCNLYFHPNTIITNSVSGKLCCGYYKGDDNFFNVVVKDNYGKKYKFIGYSGTLLCPADFTLYGLHNIKDIFKYYKMCNITGYNINDKITILGKPSNENYKLFKEVSINNNELWR